jgi:energy-coupling factor transport system permease protein
MTPRIHTWAWITWLISAAILISRTRHPLYLALIFLVIYILAIRLNQVMDNQRPVLMIRLAVSFILFSAILNALFAHYGSTILFHIPDAFPILGGVVTLEGFIFGAINGLVLACIFGAFSVVSIALPARSIIRLLPRAYYAAAVVLSIAMTFLPSTLRQFSQIREAQAVRGHRMRGIKDWLPLVMPLLIGGLERAFNLSESMTARGFSSRMEDQPAAGRQVIALLSLATLLAGWVLRLQGEFRTAGTILMLAGGALIGWLIWRSGHASPATTYRREQWCATDSLIVLCASLTWIATLLPISTSSANPFSYNPYPTLAVPEFIPWIGISILGLLGPLVAMHQEVTPSTDSNIPANPGPPAP